MHIKVIYAGKPALRYAQIGIDEYCKRLTRYGNYELVQVKAGSSEDVSARLLEKSQGCVRIVLDERGKPYHTRAFSEQMQTWASNGTVKQIAFLIGASDGHTQALRDKADLLLGLSNFTMQHELALLVLLEQLYRIASLQNGSPYHRD